MNAKLKLLGALLALSCGAAHAGVIQVGGMGGGSAGMVSAQPGVCSVSFDAAIGCGATYTASPANFVSGSASGLYAAPQGDTSVYLTVGASYGSSVTITLATAANYFGFYGGSLDSYNTVTFFLNDTQVDSFNGTQINAIAFPGTAANGANAVYVDYFASSLYNRIVYSSSENAFETDNHAFGLATPRGVPEPESIALLGLGALGLLAGRRRKAVRS